MADNSNNQGIPEPEGYADVIETDYEIGQDNIETQVGPLGLDLHNPVFVISGLSIILFVCFALALPEQAESLFGALRPWLTSNFDWFFLSAGNIFVIFCLFLIVSPWGGVRLGGAEAKPWLSRLVRDAVCGGHGHWPDVLWRVRADEPLCVLLRRDSRGRTVREFLICVLLIPTFVCVLWMSVFGGTALSQAVQDGVTSVSEAPLELKLFKMLAEMPLASIISLIGIILVVVFFVTSSNSGSLVIDTITAGGKVDAPLPQRVFWCCFEGAVAIALLIGGGLAHRSRW